MDSLTQSNEGLIIQNEILEHDLVDHDRELEAVWVELELLQADRDYLLHVGVVCVMEKFIEHPEFIGGVIRIRHATFFVGEESGHAGLKAEVDVAMYDSEANDSHSSHTFSLEDALFAFSMMDYASLFSFGSTGYVGAETLVCF